MNVLNNEKGLIFVKHKFSFFRYLLFFFVFTLCLSCEKKIQPTTLKKVGQVKILNGCGESNAAEKMAEYLISHGFDVVEKGNADHWHYQKTIVISTVKSTKIAEELTLALDDADWIQIIDSSQMVTAVVILGRDFAKIINENKWKL